MESKVKVKKEFIWTWIREVLIFDQGLIVEPWNIGYRGGRKMKTLND